MHQAPTLRSVNLLFFIVMILILVFGSLMQTTAPLWGLVGTQIFLILIPSLIFLRLSKLPFKATIRWRWPGARLALLSVLLGVAIIPFALWIGNFFIHLLGYIPDIHPGFFPRTLGQSVLMFIAIAIVAPLCEEIFFRGLVQHPYETFSPTAAILLVGFLFVIFHLSLLRFFALIPVALLLGYLVWASNSVIPGILAHAAYNTPVALSTIIASMRPDIPLDPYSSLPAMGIGFLGLIAGLLIYHRYSSPSLPPTRFSPSITFAHLWPVIIILVIFIFTAGLEFILGRFPELLVTRPLQLSTPPWQEPTRLDYQVNNQLGEPVGTASCLISPGEATYLLDCHAETRAFIVETDRIQYQINAMTSSWTIQWSAENLNVTGGNIERKGEFGQLLATLETVEDQLLLGVSSNANRFEEIVLPPNALLSYEWPFRLSALPFGVSLGSPVTLAWPTQWDTDIHDSLPGSKETTMIIRGGEPLAVPAGNFISWRVIVGQDNSAWYEVDPPHRLLRYDDGVFSYLLKE
jgi:membrane protease YdiL (CAAX protease family)